MNDKPIHTFRIGSVKASIWENQSAGGKKFFATSLAHTYRDENEQWRESSTYLPDDLPKLELAARKAFDFIHTQNLERQQPESHAEKIAAEGKGRRGATK